MLENTKYRLHHDKKINVGFFGGSITEGAGASCYENTWAGRTCAWLTKQYPDVKFSFANPSIGGTNSAFGVYRIDRELCQAHDTDLFFIEYAVNDWGSVYESIFADMEAIVRKIRTFKDTADIVFVFTTTMYVNQQSAAGEEFGSRAAHSAVAHYYGDIPTIDIGEALKNAVYTTGGGDWLRYTGDNVHPNDDGYSICGEVMINHLTKLLSGDIPAELTPCPELPPILSKIDRTKARFIEIGETTMSEGDWTRIDAPLYNKSNHYYESDKIGAWIEYRFTGYRAGSYIGICHEGAVVTTTIDGKDYDDCLQVNDMPRVSMITPRDAESGYGEHTVRLTIKGANSENGGTTFKIGGLLLS